MRYEGLAIGGPRDGLYMTSESGLLQLRRVDQNAFSPWPSDGGSVPLSTFVYRHMKLTAAHPGFWVPGEDDRYRDGQTMVDFVLEQLSACYRPGQPAR